MKQETKKTLLVTLAAVLSLSIPSLAHAEMEKDENFGNSKLKDADLDNLRGGFNIGGVNYQIGYDAAITTSNPAYGINNFQQFSFNMNSIQSANSAAQTLSQAQQALIAQNFLPGTAITSYQNLTIVAQGAIEHALQNNQIHSGIFSNTMAIRGR